MYWISNPLGAINLLGPRKTFDADTIDLTPLAAPWKWPESKDHAKWGISVEPEWVCVGDINRMISQQKRGGAMAFPCRSGENGGAKIRK